MTARFVSGITTGLAVSLLAQQPQPPTIRSRTTLVPVDVRVVDLKGNPVTDLKKEDFTVTEDGKPQEIRLFEVQNLQARPPDPGAPPLRRALAGDQPLRGQDSRTFLFVFGRGRLQWPDKGIDNAIRFVRERLLPQDRVAVLAYNRATDFTTDRTSIVATLERFKAAHDKIEADLKQQFSGLQARYGGHTPWEPVQKQIDAVFNGPGAAPARRLPPGTPKDAELIAADRRRDFDALERAGLAANRPPSRFDVFDVTQANALEVSLDQYANQSVQTAQDIENLYTGINYLKFFDGEKHLVYVTEGGLFLPRLENDHSIAALAADGRVVIDVLQTGGLITTQPSSGGQLAITSFFGPNVARVDPRQLGAGQTSRNLAELTGGMAAVYTPSAQTLAAIDVTSRSGYLLGYAPTNAQWDGRFRRIRVTVNRKDVRVLSRYGYYGREEYVPSDRRLFMTYSRIAAAGNAQEAIEDLRLSANAEYRKATGELFVNLTLAPNRVTFEHQNGRHQASLQIAYFAGDGRRSLVGEHWQVTDLDFTDATYARFQSDGLSYTQRVLVRGVPAFVKVIAYDYAADLLGSVTIKTSSK